MSIAGIDEFKNLVEEGLKEKVILVTVFGSRADGRSSALSDLDVAVLPKRKSVDARLKLTYEVTELASRKSAVLRERNYRVIFKLAVKIAGWAYTLGIDPQHSVRGFSFKNYLYGKR